MALAIAKLLLKLLPKRLAARIQQALLFAVAYRITAWWWKLAVQCVEGMTQCEIAMFCQLKQVLLAFRRLILAPCRINIVKVTDNKQCGAGVNYAARFCQYFGQRITAGVIE